VFHTLHIQGWSAVRIFNSLRSLAFAFLENLTVRHGCEKSETSIVWRLCCCLLSAPCCS
jgi:hypothetical protein